MQGYRRLMLVAILAWSTSAVAVHADEEGSSNAPCNSFCRFWLGRGNHQNEAPPPPAAAAEALPPVEAAPPDDPDTPPQQGVKRRGNRARMVSEPPATDQPVVLPPEGGQGLGPDAPNAPPPASALSQPMDLTPEEAAAAAAPRVEARPIPLPPRPPRRSRQAQAAHIRRPVPPVHQNRPGAVPAIELQPGSETVAGTGTAGVKTDHDRSISTSLPLKQSRPRAIGAAPVPVRLLPVMAATPPGPPLRARSGLSSPTLSSAAIMPPAGPPRPAELSRLDAGPVAPEDRARTDPKARPEGLKQASPALDPHRLHDVAPGPPTGEAMNQTSSIPRTAPRPVRADPEDAFEDLKATIMRSAQDALKQSEVHGF